MDLQHLKDTGKRFTYDKYGWDVDEDNNFIENEKEQYWIEYIKLRYHEDDISISQIARELNTCGVPAKPLQEYVLLGDSILCFGKGQF